MLDYEINTFGPNQVVIGLDEVGRGCLAGPLVVGYVIFNSDYQNLKIKDSKKLSPKQREEVYLEIQRDALDFGYYVVSLEEIEKLGPKKASILGMEKCLKKARIKYQIVLTDYEKIQTEKPLHNLVKGDSIAISIAAASIVAKVERDKIMDQLDLQFPQYFWKNNKGYGTKKHLESLEKFGPCKYHRIKYKPVLKYLNRGEK
ncbi:ribonuclease HII [Mycoplasmopsis gallopavonis]|uniref:Ribonuclease HII n=1 Tax=Mycoplasmopsis gallopavonis TaxID=76629 RepID=A0A449AZP0_9BACT|nr:ribonuclease HII [Mycoplasmopsis gallopavonis]RIV16225.1 ribonuclease HII [Mycoplasmopsis gallopavonis]VEU72624.1 ribonuclease HII [Mycoplasmopsis gallopavonis]VEU72983.1 ribonuclease HII [Mycoplasmopsis gallopavonis]